MQPQLYIEDKRLDLYTDESINLNQSVQSLKDLTKVFTEFTRSFKVPANDINNAIFKHYYESQIDNGFDARTKKAARIDINGVTFKYGKIQLNSVGLKSNIPEFYDIEFFGATIEIKDLIGDDTLRDLTYLDTLNFDYTGANVLSRLTTQQDVSYSLTSYNRRFVWQDSNLSTEELVNIKYGATFTDGINWKELKPHIKCMAIIEAIESEYGLVFSRDFFARQEFADLYMSLGNGDVDQDPFTTNLISSNSFSFQSRVIDGGTYTQIEYSSIVNINSGDFPYRLVVEVNGTRLFVSDFISNTPTRTFSFVQRNPEYGVYDVNFYIESEGELDTSIETRIRSNVFPLGIQDDIQDFTDVLTLTPAYNTLNYIEEIKVLDWLAAIVKAFNLVIVPQQDGTLFINDLNSWYQSGGILDISEYVDIEELKVSRGELFKEIVFGYEDTESILANEYLNQFGKQFGAEEISLEGLATDSTLEIKMPFENIQFEKLLESTVQYAFIVDSSLESYGNKPFLSYLPTQNDANIGFNTELTYENAVNVNVPSHSVTLEGGFSAQFAAEFSEFNGGLLSDNLYSRFYSDYFNDLFSTKRRKYEVTAQFTPSLLSKIAMNDRLIIKGKRYVIDNLETNILTGTTKLVLLNDLFETLSVSDTSSNLSSKFGIYTESGSVYYTGSRYAIVSSAQDWINVSKSGNLINFTLDPNTSGSDRAGVIQVEDGLSNPTLTILQPFNGQIKFDSDTITFDNNNITF